MIEFKSLRVGKELVMLLSNNGIFHPTTVQVRTIPLIYDKKDVIVQSKTGSGKTLSFAIPIIDTIRTCKHVQVLVITPTRELARQITEVFRKFGSYKELKTVTIYGGVPIEKQVNQVRAADIVVGTPGRLLDLINRRKINLTYCSSLVIDEVEQLLDMGFIEDVEKIVKRLPPQRQTLMFSATINEKVSTLAGKFLYKPKKIILENKISQGVMNQEYYHVEHSQKIPLLIKLIKERARGLTLVFCNTKQSTRYVADFLNKNNLNADCLNGDMDQRARERVLKRFVEGDIGVLIATDVAARGIHVDDVNIVFNFDMPKTIDTYTHRVGRTARQGKKGSAITIVTDKSFRKFRQINAANNNLIQKTKLPEVPEVKIPGKKERMHRGSKRMPKRRRHRR